MRAIDDLRKWKIKSDEAGYVMVMAIFVLVIATLIGVSLAVMGINEYALSSNEKLMDVAYQISEAGISRACVQIRDDATIVGTTGGTAHLYKGTGATPTWQSGTQTFGTPGWEGTYSVTIWQSELVPTDPKYKVLVSTGKITRSGRVAERTIETRIIAGASTQDYDASFDYLLYNGFYGKSWTSPAVPQNDDGVWPNQTVWLGDFTWDGITPSGGRSPKGAMYVRGKFYMPTSGFSSSRIHGNVVATNDIALSNNFISGLIIDNLDSNGVPGTDPYNQGNVVAGVDGTGSVSIDMSWSAGAVRVTGCVTAADNVSISESATIGILQVGGLVAGGDISVTRNAVYDTGGEMKLGNVFCAGDTTIDTSYSVGLLTFKRISTGGNCSLTTDGGGDLEFDSSTPVGDVFCGGKVTLNGAKEYFFLLPLPGDIYIGDVHAGGDANGEAVEIIENRTGSSNNIEVKNIIAQGSVKVTTNSAGGFTADNPGTIAAGRDSSSNGVVLNAVGPLNISGSLTAVGSINATVGGSNAATVSSMQSAEDITLTSTSGTTSTAVSVGNLTALGAINATISGSGTKTFQSMYSGDALTVNANGSAITLQNLRAVGAINATLVDLASAGWVWSGGALTLSYNAGNTSNTVGNISAGTTAAVTANLKNTSGSNKTMTFGRINANGALTFTGTRSANSTTRKTYFYIYGLKAGGNASVTVPGLAANNYGYAAIYAMNPWDQGEGTPTNTYSGYALTDCAAAGGTYTPSGTFSPTPVTKAGVSWTPATPGVDIPTAPTAPSTPAGPFTTGPSEGYPPGTGTWLDGPASGGQKPVVNQSTVLKVAGLEGPAQLLEPNWQFFLDSATADQAASGVPHVLVDGGTGDSDNTANGVVKFLWSATNYSSNETIYQGDAGVTVQVDINWEGKGNSFKGNLVTKGNVKITNNMSGGGWRFDSSQELNIISGRDISKDTAAGSGFYWVNADNVKYHWWARGDIIFTNGRFNPISVTTFNGSLVAGNRIYYDETYLWNISKFQWTRWAIDTNAWLPPFTVLSYREI
jgi:hypothetical protein